MLFNFQTSEQIYTLADKRRWNQHGKQQWEINCHLIESAYYKSEKTQSPEDEDMHEEQALQKEHTVIVITLFKVMHVSQVFLS